MLLTLGDGKLASGRPGTVRSVVDRFGGITHCGEDLERNNVPGRSAGRSAGVESGARGRAGIKAR